MLTNEKKKTYNFFCSFFFFSIYISENIINFNFVLFWYIKLEDDDEEEHEEKKDHSVELITVSEDEGDSEYKTVYTLEKKSKLKI